MRPGRLREALVVLALVGTSLLVFPGPRFLPQINTDDCWTALTARRIAAGAWPHEGIQCGQLYPGLLALTLGRIYRLAGPDLATINALLLLVGTAVAAALFRVTREIAPLAIAALIGAGFLATGISFSYGLAVTWFALLFGLLALWILVRSAPEPRPLALYATGALCGIGFLFKHTAGAFHVLAILVTLWTWALARAGPAAGSSRAAAIAVLLLLAGVFASVSIVILQPAAALLNLYLVIGSTLLVPASLAWRALRNRRPLPAPRSLLEPTVRLGAGFASVIALYVGAFRLRGGTPLVAALIRDTFVLPRQIVLHTGLSYSVLGDPVHTIATAGLLGALAGVVALGARSRAPGRWSTAILALGAVGLPVFAVEALSTGRLLGKGIGLAWETFRAAPVLLLTGLSCWLVLRLAGKRDSDPRLLRLQAVTAFAAFHLLVLAPSCLFSYFVISVTPIHMVAGGALGGTARWRPAHSLGLCAYVFVCAILLVSQIASYRAGGSEREVLFDGVAAAYLDGPAAARVRELDDARRRHLNDGETALFFSEPLLALIARSSNPTTSPCLWVDFLQEGIATRFFDDELRSIVACLSERRARLVVIGTGDREKVCREIQGALDRSYRVVERVDGVLFLVPRGED